MRLTCLTLLILSLASCDLISREAGYPGGNLGYTADRRTLFAKSQEQRVNRYLVSLALIAPLAAETTGTPAEARLTADRIRDLYRNIDKLEKAAARCRITATAAANSAVTANCAGSDATNPDGNALTFETLAFEVNKSLNDALKQSFDNLNLRVNLENTLALEPVEILRTILRARRLIPILIEYLAVYRDVTVTFGLSVNQSCINDPQTGCDDVATALFDLVNRTRTADSDMAKDERPVRAVYKAGKTALNSGLDWKLQAEHRAALLLQVNRACQTIDALAAIDADPADLRSCTINLTAGTATFRSGPGTSSAQAAASSLLAGPKLP